MNTQTEFLKRTRGIIENNNKLIELNLKADYFFSKEQKQATENALEMNNDWIGIINQEIEAIRLGITLTL